MYPRLWYGILVQCHALRSSAATPLHHGTALTHRLPGCRHAPPATWAAETDSSLHHYRQAPGRIPCESPPSSSPRSPLVRMAPRPGQRQVAQARGHSRSRNEELNWRNEEWHMCHVVGIMHQSCIVHILAIWEREAVTRPRARLTDNGRMVKSQESHNG